MSKATCLSALTALSLLLLASPYALSAGEHAIDPLRSKITIHVGKTGLFSAAGHEHEVSAPITEGAIDDSDPEGSWAKLFRPAKRDWCVDRHAAFACGGESRSPQGGTMVAPGVSPG